MTPTNPMRMMIPMTKAAIFENENSPNWKWIPGFGYRYQVNANGEIRGWYAARGNHGRLECPKKVNPYLNHRSKYPTGFRQYVSLMRPDGTRANMMMTTIMRLTWMPPQPNKDSVIYHINGDLRNNKLSNLAWIDKHKLGKITARTSGKYTCGHTRKVVAKIDRDMNIICVYPSARAAAKKNYCSTSAVCFHCNQKTKRDPFSIGNGEYDFRWMDDMEKAPRKRMGRPPKILDEEVLYGNDSD